MKFTMESRLPCDPALMWEQVADTGTFRLVSAPLMVFRSRDHGGLPRQWVVGETYALSMWLLGCIPLGGHWITIATIDRSARRFSTAERGALIKGWNHTMQVKSDGRDGALFRDDLVVRSGIMTPLIFAGAYLFFLYRHWRMGKLIRDGRLFVEDERS
ncbi:hypothetical protein ACFFSY_15235 [Paenibacillus aurantiacus]|uniref:RDD family protein n=1 Tax=Paenibacillus aurantiacus TaxID=1936118 RepID=A0ABV5KPY0_9BACL